MKIWGAAVACGGSGLAAGQRRRGGGEAVERGNPAAREPHVHTLRHGPRLQRCVAGHASVRGAAHLLRARDAVARGLDAEGQGDEEGPAAHKRACGSVWRQGHTAGVRPLAIGSAWQRLAAEGSWAVAQQCGQAGRVAGCCPRAAIKKPLLLHPPRMAVTKPTGPATAAFLVSSAMWADES